MPGSPTAPRGEGTRSNAPVRVVFRYLNSIRLFGVKLFRGSMAGLCAPLPTLRLCPCGQRRTARGRCGLLVLHHSGLAPPTPCRSPGALRLSRDFYILVIERHPVIVATTAACTLSPQSMTHLEMARRTNVWREVTSRARGEVLRKSCAASGSKSVMNPPFICQHEHLPGIAADTPTSERSIQRPHLLIC